MQKNLRTLTGFILNDRRTGRKSMLVLIVAACFVFASAIVWAAPIKQKELTDQQILVAVDQALLTDAALLNNQIDTVTKDGIVTLSGTVNNLLTKERASKIAETIRGVRGVVNTITLMTPSRSDQEILNDVVLALLYDPATDFYELTPEVKDGVVTLSGTVQSFHEKQLSVYVAKSVKGVNEVIDNITMKNEIERPDSEIVAEARNILANDVWLSTNVINTNVRNGVVTLTGTVGSSALRNRAFLLAWTNGVKSVNVDGLSIEPWAKSSDQGKVDAATSDTRIKQAVHDAFLYDPRVYSFNPAIEVEAGVVTLTGVVNNLKAKRAAEQDAKNTVGVWRVKNLLKVRPDKKIADDTLRENVTSAFLRDPFVDNYQIDVNVKNGVITLTGAVDSYYEKAQAEDIASRAKGALNVKNNLTVSYPALVYYNLGHDPNWAYTPFYAYWNAYRPPYYSTWPYTSDVEIKASIEDRMYWSPWIDFYGITVKVTNGAATLTGAVDSWFQFNKATEVAYEGGASQVYNNINVTVK